MSLVSNEVFGEPFELVEMTTAINRLPYKEQLLTSLFNWNITRSTTTGVRINVAGREIRAVPSTPRGGVPPTRHGDKRNAVTVEIPGYSERSSIMNREALNVQAGLDGQSALITLEELRNERLQLMSDDLDLTDEHQSAQAIKGKIVDVDGTELVDLYDLMDVDQAEFVVDLDDSSKDLAIQLEEIKEYGEIALGGTPIDHWIWINGSDASKRISSNAMYREALSDPLARILSKEDGRKGTRLNDDIDVVHYRKGYFDPTDSYLVPVYEGCAQLVYGPHEAEEFWGNVLPRYVTKELLRHGQGIEMEAWTFMLRYFQRPEGIIKIDVKGGLKPIERKPKG